MEPVFIYLNNGRDVVNVNHIVRVRQEERRETVVWLSDGKNLYVSETLDRVMGLIKRVD